MFENPDQLEISCQQTKELLDGEVPLILIDCREQHEFDFCRIEGAILIPLSDEAGREKSEALLKNVNQEAIIYCHHGVRSLHATQYLRQLGYANTLSMKGGIDAWSAQIDPAIERY